MALGGVTEGISGVLSEVSLATVALAREAIEVVAKAISDLSLARSSIGAVQSRLHQALEGLYSSRTAHATALSVIADADVAEESAKLVRSKILQQQGGAILAQIGTLSASMVLSLLRL